MKTTEDIRTYLDCWSAALSGGEPADVRPPQFDWAQPPQAHLEPVGLSLLWQGPKWSAWDGEIELDLRASAQWQPSRKVLDLLSPDVGLTAGQMLIGTIEDPETLREIARVCAEAAFELERARGEWFQQ